MKKKMLLIALTLCSFYAQATQLIQGDVTPVTAENGCPTCITTTFKHAVNATAYDRANGIFWVGLNGGLSAESQEYSVSTFQRIVDSGQIPRFIPRASAGRIPHNERVRLLTMATNDGDTCSRVAGVLESSTVQPNANQKVFLLTLNGISTISEILNAYNPIVNEDGSGTEGVVAIAANHCFIFAAVNPGDSSTFGDENSGIAVVCINQKNLELEQTAAVPGDAGIKAQQLDNFSPYIRINGDTTNRHPIISNTPQLVWDDPLQRLYIGVSLDSGAEESGDGLLSIVLAQVTDCPSKGELPLFYFAPNDLFNTDENNIVGVVLPDPVEARELTVASLAVMHASTGPSYLIVHGGNGTATNQIFALPLVDLCDPAQENQGKLANKDAFNANTHHYEQIVTDHEQLTTSDDLFAKVGNGPLPIPANQSISQMVVIGDAVYVSFNLSQSDTNETGILYSQALFDDVGRIKSWTPWTKRVWPICGFPDSTSSSAVSYFAVDAVTGKVIAVDVNNKQTVRITEWDKGGICINPCQTNCSLAAILNKSLCSGAYSVLDLDQSTRGIGETIPYRYTLFGGTNKVDFALVSTSRAESMPYDINETTTIPYPQWVTIDYCCPDYFRETCLPEGAGCVSSLEYARRTEEEGATNYFFAGTNAGLFAFAQQNGSGFPVSDLNLLTIDAIAHGSWQYISAISESIVDIKSAGNALYVLTLTSSCEKPFASRLLRIGYEDTLAAMFDPSNIFIIAESGIDSASPALAQTLLFTAIDIIQTSADGSQEQLVLTTNNGIFQSKAANGIQEVTNQTDANWTNLCGETLFYGIGSVDNATIKSTDWPFSAQDQCGYRTFERSSIHQLNSATNNNADFRFVPGFFNHIITCYDPCRGCTQGTCCIENCTTPCQDDLEVCSAFCDPNCCLDTMISNPGCNEFKLFEKISYFWSDGGRRFFIVSPTNSKIGCIPCCGKKQCCCTPLEQLSFLEVTPFNTFAWNVCDPLQTVLQDCILRTQSAFYWVRPIGMTGIILAGTPNGVVALE